jgi:hypothetical protein
MLAPTIHSKPSEPASAVSKFVVGIALCVVAALLVHLVERWGARGVSYYLRDVHMVLQQWGGKWICAGLISLLGLAFCWNAVRQLLTTAPRQRFAEGTMVLESMQWMRQPPQENAAPPSRSE